MAIPGPGDKDKKKKGKTKTTTSTGTPEVIRSKSRITGKDGQEGMRRTETTTTPTIRKIELTPEGDKAYAAKSKTDQIAQDKAWAKMSQSKDVKVTNIDNFGVRNVQPEGIKPLGSLYTGSPKIERAKERNMTASVYKKGGTLNPDNKRNASISNNINAGVTKYSESKVPMGDREMTSKQATNLKSGVDRTNKKLDDRYGESRIRSKFEGKPKEFIDKKVKEGAKRISANQTIMKIN